MRTHAHARRRAAMYTPYESLQRPTTLTPRRCRAPRAQDSDKEISFTEYAALVMSTPARSRGLTIKDGVLRCTFDHAALKLCIYGTVELRTEVDAVLGASKGCHADMSSVRDVGSKFKKPLLMALLHKWSTPDGET